MRRKPRLRKQHVQLRRRERTVLKRRVEVVIVLGLLAVVLSRLGSELTGSRGVIVSRYISQHTPKVVIDAPANLVGLPLLKDLPGERFYLWFPGWESHLRNHWRREYPVLRGVHLEKHFGENQVVVRLEPRVPLVVTQGQGMDGDGVIFPIGQVSAPSLRTASVSGRNDLAAIGRWITELTRVPPLWGSVVAIVQDTEGDLSLDLRTGTHVAWGPLEAAGTNQKAHALSRVLDDVHQRLGGAALADVRFFDEGRIIIRPKSVT